MSLDVKRVALYNKYVIRNFKCKETQKIFNLVGSRAFPADIQRVVLRKLKMLNQALVIGDLMAFPANRLEKLKGSRVGQWSIRVNDQWRICFAWKNGEALDVELVDYH